MSKKMDELRDMLCEELYGLQKKVSAKGELGAPELEAIDKLTHSIKSIDTIVAMEDACGQDDENGYSERGRSPYMNDGGSSYARGRGRYAKRDSMGRYSRDNYSRGDRYSRNSYRSNGYSRDDGRDEMLEHIEDMMNEAQDERTRQMIMNWKNQLESM